MPAHPTKPKSADDRNLVPVDENYAAPGLDDQMRLFWDKNSKLILIVAALLALAILGNEGRKYLARQHAETVAAAYASSGTDTALRAFLADYPDEPQAGPALLRLADAAYTLCRARAARRGRVHSPLRPNGGSDGRAEENRRRYRPAGRHQGRGNV
jgi:hypothetical protein